MRPDKKTYPEYYENYIPLVKEDNILDALLAGKEETISFFKSIPADLEVYAYEPGKWSIEEVLNHCIDTERIFCYRALRFARNDFQQPLPFDQDAYVMNAELAHRTLADQIEEFETVRNATISLYKSFSNDVLLRTGQTAAGKASVLALGFAMCGHTIHHIKVIKEKYLSKH